MRYDIQGDAVEPGVGGCFAGAWFHRDQSDGDRRPDGPVGFGHFDDGRLDRAEPEGRGGKIKPACGRGRAPDGEESSGNFDFTVDQSATECRALCDADAACAGWHYEPAGSYFIDHPRCHLKGHRFAVRAVAQGEGWVAGIKPGVKLILAQ